MALDALHTAIMSQRVNWVLDADIRSFFAQSTTSGCCGWWRTGSPEIAPLATEFKPADQLRRGGSAGKPAIKNGWAIAANPFMLL